jgi:integral membrane protein
LALLLIAMPLKYFYDKPWAVKYFGWCHGVLFVTFGLYLIKVWIKYNWSFTKATGAFVASLMPLGTFFLDRQLKKEYPEN